MQNNTFIMKVVFTGSFNFPFGMASTKRVTRIAEYFSSLNNNVIMLLFRNKDNPRSGHVDKIKYQSLATTNVLLTLLCLPYFIILLFYNIISNEKHKVLYVYSGISIENFVIVLTAKLFSYKIIVDIVEDFKVHQEKITKLRKIKIWSVLLLEKYYEYFVDGIIVNSIFLEQKFKKKFLNSIPIIFVPVSAKVRRYQYHEFHNPVRLVYSGTYGNKDGIEYIIEAIRILKEKKINIELHLLGPCKNQIILNTFSNDSFIKYHGLLNDSEFYRFIKYEADVLCLNRIGSDYAKAGFPFKLCEYLATGNPTISSNICDISTFLTGDVDVIFTETGSAFSIANAVEKIIQNPIYAKNIGINGRDKAIKYFNPEINGKIIYDFLLHEVFNRKLKLND